MLVGPPQETERVAQELVAQLGTAEVLWVSDSPWILEPSSPTESGTEALRIHPRSEVLRLLGASYEAVVIDHHDRVDAETLGRCHGFVKGGGALILRQGQGSARTRLESHLNAVFAPEEPNPGAGGAEKVLVVECVGPSMHLEPMRPSAFAIEGSAEQANVVARLVRCATSAAPNIFVLIADRGRGKSAALGLALAALADDFNAQASTDHQPSIIVSGPNPDAAREIFRFGGPHPFVDLVSLANRTFPNTYATVFVDEAAQLPLPLLKRAVERHDTTTFVFATTVHGYEGTGRGFSLRFVPWLQTRPRPVETATLTTPIRWAPGDPLEAAVFEALALDAQLPALQPTIDAPIRCIPLDRDRLVAQPTLLRAFFGLLVQAHYRTTPRDLQQLLEAPNVYLHGLYSGDTLVGATWVAEEGGWSAELCQDVVSGKQRVRGHALPESIVAHLGHHTAGEMTMLRSVRIAIHPEIRLRGLGTTLVEHVHASYSPDLFGTLFGATSGLIAFRRSQGYEVVRLSASRGARSGEPSVVMVRPVTERAQALVASLRSEFARDLPLQLELLTAGEELLLEPQLAVALNAGLATTGPNDGRMTDAQVRAGAVSYAWGPRTFESCATAVCRFADQHSALLPTLPPAEAAVIRSRVLGRSSWQATLTASELPNHRMGMRALRRGIRGLIELTTKPGATE